MGLKFSWDARKATRNLAKHGVSFDEAPTVFADGLSLTIPDPDHSEDEERCGDHRQDAGYRPGNGMPSN